MTNCENVSRFHIYIHVHVRKYIYSSTCSIKSHISPFFFSVISPELMQLVLHSGFGKVIGNQHMYRSLLMNKSLFPLNF